MSVSSSSLCLGRAAVCDYGTLWTFLLPFVDKRTFHCILREGLGYTLHRLGSVIIEPLHDKTNKMTGVPSEDSDQPGHPPRMISLCCSLNG